MTEKWLVTIEAWPHSTNRGADVDQKEAGDRVQKFVVGGVDLGQAFANAELIAQGMRTNPMVWRTPILSIVHSSEVSA